MVIGSDSTCDIHIDDPEVSEEHASLRLHDGALEIRDLGSRSGTFVNAQRISEPTALGSRDEVRVASTVLAPVQSGTAVAPATEASSAEVAPALMAAPGTGSVPPATTAAPAGGSKKRRNIALGAGALLLVAIAAVIAIIASSGSSGPLSESEIINADKPSTLMVVGRGVGASPITGGTNKVLDSGSAWVYNGEEGLVVTNAHVVLNASTFEAGYESNSLARANLVAVDARNDLAMLKVKRVGVKDAAFGRTRGSRTGRHRLRSRLPRQWNLRRELPEEPLSGDPGNNLDAPRRSHDLL